MKNDAAKILIYFNVNSVLTQLDINKSVCRTMNSGRFY